MKNKGNHTNKINNLLLPEKMENETKTKPNQTEKKSHR